MALESLTYFCTAANVEGVLSANGVKLRLDDDQDGAVSSAELEYLTFARGDATETVRFACWMKYADSWLATSNWVNTRATWLAAYALCDRRGNPCPDSIVDRCERYQEELDAIADGKRLIPMLPLRTGLMPAYSNSRVDPRYQFRVLRVEKRSSSQHPSSLPRVTDYTESFFVEM